jgi:hypothetical protein
MSENFLSWMTDLLTIGLPPCAWAWAWLSWIRKSSRMTIGHWHRVATRIALSLVILSIALGDFALIYWRHSAEPSPAPPQLTVTATYAGVTLALLGVPLSAVSVSWTRVALLIGSLGLLGFYLVLFISP